MVQLKIDISFNVLLGAHDQRIFFGGGGASTAGGVAGPVG
jgi:hypothetical protein